MGFICQSWDLYVKVGIYMSQIGIYMYVATHLSPDKSTKMKVTSSSETKTQELGFVCFTLGFICFAETYKSQIETYKSQIETYKSQCVRKNWDLYVIIWDLYVFRKHINPRL